MAEVLKGAAVVEALNQKLSEQVVQLKEKGVTPTLAIVRVGERPDDVSYERGATKRCEKIGVDVRHVSLPQAISQDALIEEIERLNKDSAVHGVLLFRPLPKEIDENIVRNTLCPQKDVDGITDASLAGVFAGVDTGYPPCTPAACMEILDYYGVDPKGKNVTVVGRSLVVGKPVAMMLMGRHATVTMCHTRTTDMPAVCRQAEILIVSAGRAQMVDKSYLSAGQVVIDVGINVNEEGNLCGDVNYDDAMATVGSVTPVPGGVGTVTTSVLVKHVVMAATRQSKA